MKVIAAWILLGVYLNASAQMLLPFGKDVLAHVFWHEHHIKHVHHGDHSNKHVHHEMAAQHQDDTGKTGNPSPAYVNDILSVHLTPDYIPSSINFILLFSALNTSVLSLLRQTHGAVFSPPPEVRAYPFSFYC